MLTEQFTVTGMACAACSAAVQKGVSKLDGVSECDVNLITGKMLVSFDESRLTPEQIVKAVEKLGFNASFDKSETAPEKEEPKKESPWPLIISLFFSGILLYISMGQMLFENLPLPQIINMHSSPFNFALTQLLLCLPALYFGRRFFTNGIPLLIKGHPNMDSLVAVGAGASLIYSIVMTYTVGSNPHAVHNLYYESVAVVISLVMLGKYFERKSRLKTTEAITSLLKLSPDTATVLKNEKEFVLPLNRVEIDDVTVVKPGERIPLDGVIIKGETSVNESMLTGESLPIEKSEGSSVVGGSINLNGLIFVKVTKIGADTTLAKIIKFVEDAQSKKAPISKVADKVSGIFVPTVITIALLASIIWLIAGAELSFVLKIFTSVLVVACPCALGLATPTAIMVGTGLGAKNGILIRNGEVLETTHKISVAVFDKTGTVTTGKPIVTDIVSNNAELIIKAAATAESGSTHPLALAITRYAKKNNIPFASPEQFVSLSGKGIRCKTEGNTLLLGKASFLTENSIDVSQFISKAEEKAAEGKSLVFVAENETALGFIAVADELKPTSYDAFQKLKAMGIKTILLSGDNRLCAEQIGKELEADKIYSEVLPQRKAGIIKEIRAEYGSVMMIGDGINDAPALTEADIGCAIGSGSDIAIDSADIVLMHSDPLDVAKVISLSRVTMKNIKENLFWAFCYNTVCIPIAAGLLYAFGGPLLSPMLAGLAMSLSSVFVVGNALRLRGKKL